MQNRLICILALAAAPLAALGQQPPKVKMPKDLGAWAAKARASLVRDLKDAESARFRDTYVSSQDFGGTMLPTLCGQINAKNGYGAYGGFQRFIVAADNVMFEESTTGFQYIWDEACGWRLKAISK